MTDRIDELERRIAAIEAVVAALRSAAAWHMARQSQPGGAETVDLRGGAFTLVRVSEATSLPCACDEWGPGHLEGCSNEPAAVVEAQPCGHPPTDIVSADEGTGYCQGCEGEADPDRYFEPRLPTKAEWNAWQGDGRRWEQACRHGDVIEVAEVHYPLNRWRAEGMSASYARCPDCRFRPAQFVNGAWIPAPWPKVGGEG